MNTSAVPQVQPKQIMGFFATNFTNFRELLRCFRGICVIRGKERVRHLVDHYKICEIRGKRSGRTRKEDDKGQAKEKSMGKGPVTEERIFLLEPQEIAVDTFDAPGLAPRFRG